MGREGGQQLTRHVGCVGMQGGTHLHFRSGEWAHQGAWALGSHSLQIQELQLCGHPRVWLTISRKMPSLELCCDGNLSHCIRHLDIYCLPIKNQETVVYSRCHVLHVCEFITLWIQNCGTLAWVISSSCFQTAESSQLMCFFAGPLMPFIRFVLRFPIRKIRGLDWIRGFQPSFYDMSQFE